MLQSNVWYMAGQTLCLLQHIAETYFYSLLTCISYAKPEMRVGRKIGNVVGGPVDLITAEIKHTVVDAAPGKGATSCADMCT